MSYPAEHRRLTKEKIVRSARRLFNRHGFDTVSIDDVMADAGLTRGSFYSYFESKGDLYAEAVTQILNEKQLLSNDGVSINPRAVDSAAQFVRDYLSREHFEDIDGTCPLIAFPTDFLHKEHRVRQAFETVLRVMIDIFVRRALTRAPDGQSRRIHEPLLGPRIQRPARGDQTQVTLLLRKNARRSANREAQHQRRAR